METPFQHKNDHPFTFNGQFVYRWSAQDWQNMGQRFHALHMALIPFGPFRGRVVAWAYNVPGNPTGIPSGVIFWSIFDPSAAPTDPSREMNFRLVIPPTGGRPNDIACAGHTWRPDARLLVTGGTEKYAVPPNSPDIYGAKLGYVFDPTVDPLLNVAQGAAPGAEMWTRLTPDMQRKRWYPTGTLGAEFGLNDSWFLSSGGHLDDTQNPIVQDDYELWRPAAGWQNVAYPGPSVALPGVLSELWAYPRMHLLSNQHVFVAGMFRGPPHRASSLPMPYTASAWTAKGVTTQYREYGTSVLHPNIDDRHTDAVMIVGGLDGNGVTATTALCKGTAAASGSFDATPQGYDWKALPSLNHARSYLNAVLLPDATVLAIGGADGLHGSPGTQPVLQIERYRAGAWGGQVSLASARLYHQTALLLPDARVLVAGGELRTWDYEVFRPTYLHACAPRPQWLTDPPDDVTYNYQYEVDVDIDAGGTVEKVVFQRPGSVTHHFDQDQRYVQVDTEAGSKRVAFVVPNDRELLPPGFWMVFLVSNADVPSDARWVRVQ